MGCQTSICRCGDQRSTNQELYSCIRIPVVVFLQISHHPPWKTIPLGMLGNIFFAVCSPWEGPLSMWSPGQEVRRNLPSGGTQSSNKKVIAQNGRHESELLSVERGSLGNIFCKWLENFLACIPHECDLLVMKPLIWRNEQ